MIEDANHLHHVVRNIRNEWYRRHGFPPSFLYLGRDEMYILRKSPFSNVGVSATHDFYLGMGVVSVDKPSHIGVGH
jgi:hypothetical protein